ncbi:MAG: thiol reductant ABC exporter subunit CydD [Nostocoides sp.]
MRPFDPRLYQQVPAVRRPVLVLGVVGVASGLATIATAFALAALAVAVVTGPDTAWQAPAWWLIGAFAVRGSLAWLSESVAARAGVAVSTGLRSRLIGHWLRQPVDSRPEADRAVTLAAQGCASVEPYAAKFLPALITAAVVPVLAVLSLLFVDPWSALIVVLTLPLLPLFAALIGKTTQEETDKRWAALAQLSGHFLDVMRGLPTLSAYGRAERQRTTIAEVSQRHRVATVRTLRLAFMSSAALEMLATISVAIVAVSVGLRLTNGNMALHAGLLAILLAPEAYWPIRRVGAEFHTAADGAEAIEAVLTELGKAPPATVESLGGGAPAPALPQRGHDVVVTQVSYAYPGMQRLVLDHVSFAARSGLTVITGPSGAGKTTLLELIAGLREPTSGSIDAPTAHLVTQRPFLTSGSIRENLTIGEPHDDDRLWDALRTVGLDGVVAALPDALGERLGDDGFGLSAGQRARLVLARATLSTSTVLLLDEPTAHLDAQSSQNINAVIADLATWHTVIAVTHRGQLLERADHHVQLPVTVAAEASSS